MVACGVRGGSGQLSAGTCVSGACGVCGGPLFRRACLADHRAIRRAAQKHLDAAPRRAYILEWRQEVGMRARVAVSVADVVGPVGRVRVWPMRGER